MNDICRFCDGIKQMYAVDACDVFEQVVGDGSEVLLGWKVKKDGKEFIVASTYVVSPLGELRHKERSNRMMVIDGDDVESFETLGDCMNFLGIPRK